ncbi:MAG: methyl-accepting chemotaxis protein [Lachnospiraceae bacterium]|nr:methyl-accepting chemotaxis protein [Lachnospiraceae bacterium]
MKVRRFSISAMLLVIIIVVLVVSTVTLSLFSISHSNRSITEAVQQRMLDVANCAAASVDGDALEKLTADDMDSPEYWKAYNALAVFRDNVSLEYVYGIKDEGNNKFTFTVDPALEDAADFGDEVATTDALIGASKGTPGVDDEPYADEWGLHYSAYSPVRNSAGKVAGIIGVDFDATWYDEQITSHTRTVILVSLCMLVLGVVIVLFVSINIKKRFKILNKMLVSLADGSGDLTRKLEIRSGDEFEVLANSMNEFIVQIRAIVGGVKDNVAEFTSASDNLTVAAEKASGTMDNLSIAIAEVAKGASVQAEDVATSSEDVKDIVSKLSEMTQSAQRAEKYADDMSKSSTEVAGNFDGLIAAIKDSMDQLMQVTKEIESVGTSVDSVIEAANIIDSIANQTNLLALNASIEAARAGEAGRGFAVVAEEIGNLAAQSNSSASSIKNIMSELKGQTSAAIKMVSQLNVVMHEQEKTSTVSRESLTSLFEVVDETKKSFVQVRDGASEIQSVCEKLNETISELSTISEQNESSSQETASSVNEIKDITATVTEKASTIKDLSGKLGQMVGGFKV